MYYGMHTIQIKRTSSYPMMNSLLCTCIQLHKLRFCMWFFIQTTPIHYVKDNITIIICRVNQNKNNLITKLTIHLNDTFLMVYMYVIQCCIDSRNTLTNIPNILLLLYTIYLRPTTRILWANSLKVLLTACPTLQSWSTITSILLLLWPTSLSSYIELLLWCHIFFYSPFWCLVFFGYHLPLPLAFPFHLLWDSFLLLTVFVFFYFSFQ